MILFVGDRPSAKMKPGAQPFEGAACEKRLLEWITSVSMPHEGYRIVNADNKKTLRQEIQYSMIFKYPVIALGNNASQHLCSMGVQHFKLPHPSGRNRQINNKKFIKSRLAECKKWLEGR